MLEQPTWGMSAKLNLQWLAQLNSMKTHRYETDKNKKHDHKTNYNKLISKSTMLSTLKKVFSHRFMVNFLNSHRSIYSV